MYIFKIKWALSLSFNQLNSNQLKLKGKRAWGVALLVKSLPSMHKALDSIPVLYKLVVLMHQGICTDVHTEVLVSPVIAGGLPLVVSWHTTELCVSALKCETLGCGCPRGAHLLHTLNEAGCLWYLVWMWCAIQGYLWAGHTPWNVLHVGKWLQAVCCDWLMEAG